MVLSRDNAFEVYFRRQGLEDKDPQSKFKELTTVDGVFVIAEPGEEFMIVFSADNKFATYAVKVIVDGYELPPKYFRRYGTLLGFKEQDIQGLYKSFKFKKPESESDNPNIFTTPKSKGNYLSVDESCTNDRTDYKGGPGEIVIKIYKTYEKRFYPKKEETDSRDYGRSSYKNLKQDDSTPVKCQVPSPKRSSDKPFGADEDGDEDFIKFTPEQPEPSEKKEDRRRKYETFRPFGYNDKKDSLDQSLGIGYGEQVQARPYQAGGKPLNRFDNTKKQSVGMFNEVGLLASFRFFYTDIQTIIKRKYINLDYPQHLSIVTLRYFQTHPETVIQAFQTIIRNGRALEHDAVDIEQIVKRCGYYFNFPVCKLFLDPKTEPDQGTVVIDEMQDELYIKDFFRKHPEWFKYDADTQKYKMGKPVKEKSTDVDLEEVQM